MERIDKLIDKFKSKSATHPNISLLWINYLEAKKKNLDTRLVQGEKLIDGLTGSGDISESLLMCLLVGPPDT